jgi:hypothetical protein
MDKSLTDKFLEEAAKGSQYVIFQIARDNIHEIKNLEKIVTGLKWSYKHLPSHDKTISIECRKF